MSAALGAVFTEEDWDLLARVLRQWIGEGFTSDADTIARADALRDLILAYHPSLSEKDEPVLT